MGRAAGIHTPKLAVVGAGSVGATLAYTALVRGAAQDVAIYDINAAKVRAEALDIAHGIQFMNMARIVGSDDIEVCRDADIIAVTAGAKQQPGQSRLDLAAATTRLMSTLIPQLQSVAPEAVILLVTNPVDLVTYAAQKISGLPAHRIFGSGTVLDSSRLRYLISERVGIAIQNIHAYIVGEHGDSEFALWSTATVGSIPLLEYGARLGVLDDADCDRIQAEVIGSAYQIIEGKGATNYAIALAATRIIESVLRDEMRVLPVSTLLTDYRGISDIALSVPCVVGRHTLDQLDIPMNDRELGLLRASADRLRSVATDLGL